MELGHKSVAVAIPTQFLAFAFREEETHAKDPLTDQHSFAVLLTIAVGCHLLNATVNCNPLSCLLIAL